MLENFGFRVLEELPTELAGGIGYIHDFHVEIGAEADLESILGRTGEIERAIANVLCGAAEDDEFNQLVLYAGLDTQPVVWLRAWFRYLRQTGSSFGLVTVADALRRAPGATPALIGMFTAKHDPALEAARRAGGALSRAARSTRWPRFARSTTTEFSAGCARWFRRSFAPTPSRPPPRRRWRSRSTPRRCRGFRRRCRGAKSGSTARASRAFTCAAGRSRAAASAGPTGATTSAPKSSA